MSEAVVIQYPDGREFGLDADTAFDSAKIDGDKTHKDLGAKIVRYQADDSPYKPKRAAARAEDKAD